MDTAQADYKKIVDLDALIAAGNNRVLKSLPRFIINKMKGILCEEQLNAIHFKHRDKTGIDFVNAMLSELEIEVKMHHPERIAKQGRYIFVANHPLGGIDALAFLSCIHQLTGEVISPSNELFNNIPNLHPLIVGVNVFGRNNKDKSEAVIKAFASDAQVMIFPAGKVSRKQGRQIQDLQWHKAFVSKAVQNQRDIVPVFITGQNSQKFYRIARLRQFFHIKMSVETLFLPQEMFKKKTTRIELVFGKPVSWKAIDKSKNPQCWAQCIREMVYDLGQNFHAIG